ncbi:TonB-dependent receptor [Mucilaginibacter sp. SMC90]|uniref:SusC/RagA family TonB-linked outer membrane protein n=1 Tax=Mucilaginibacter sp. SMC90 TaxID=2929803 RepID=UPI001FB1F45D|nr:TonB-dependent receptor [Mucilaginibacter sp. SMC90]UOE47255.1 TonB-dependent receptor [Mucilaginibacter sp. SMC90]
MKYFKHLNGVRDNFLPYSFLSVFLTSLILTAAPILPATAKINLNGHIQANDILIKGKVTDSKGLPIPGVNVKIQGTKSTTITDSNGLFSIKAPSKSGTLVFTYVGFSSKTVPFDGSDTITVILNEQTTSLNDVVIVSYGTQSKRDVTGSIAQLDASKLKDLPVGQFAQQLQGQIAGVNANINTGRPGQGLAIQIRGAISINAGNYPLIVVDGQPLSAINGQNPINNINPDEIESFTVLKDASATALYGSRAASGVILITTKQAKAGKTRIDFNGYYGIASLDGSHVPKMMDANQLATFMNEFFRDKIKYEGYVNPATGTATVPAEYANPAQYGKGTNWLNRVLRNAPTQNYSLSISDSREKSSTSIIAGYFKQDGIVKNTGYERYSIRVNNELRPTSKIKIGLNVAPSYQIDHNSAGSPTDGQRNIIEGALLSSPLINPFNADGTPVNQATGFFLLAEPNFEQVALNTNNVVKTTRLLANSYIQVDVLKGLTFKTSADADLSGQTNNQFVNTIAAAGFNAPPPRPISSISATSATSNYLSWVNENTLNYKLSFLKDHQIEALGGYTIQKFTNNSSAAYGTNFPDASIPYISAAGTTTGTSSFTEWSLLSMIGRLNYKYQDKYLFSAAIRRDGSSKFGSNRQYGVFPSASVGWVVTNESFMKNMPTVNNLKLRASYGLTGNNNFNSGNYPSISLLSPIKYVFDNTVIGGKYVSQVGNADLTWEKNKQFDFGVDIGILNNRITFTYDYYHKITDGLLYQIDLPESSGFSSVNDNIGTFKFWGHEFSVNSVNLTGALKWNTSFNITFNRNLIQKLGTQNLPIMPPQPYDFPNIQQVGKPIGMFYGYVADGVYMNQQQFDSQPKDVTSQIGTVRMKDINGDGKITPDDRTIIGNPNPNFLFGLTNHFTYKKFDLNIVLSGAIGGQIEDERAQSAANLDGAFNLYANQLDHWRSPSDPGNGTVPRTLAGTTALYRTVNSLWVHDGSYVTCRNFTLGYTFKIANNKYINNLRVFSSVQQLFTITKYPGFSPETNSQGSANLNGLNIGVDNTQYPIPRTISFGVNMGLF